MTDRKRLYAGVAVAVLLAAAGGFALARWTTPEPPAVAAPHADDVDLGLTMSAEAIGASGIVVQTVTAGGLAGEVLTQGTVTAAPGAEALLTARASGAVIRINRQLGDAVRAGEVLAVVESREAAQIAADGAAASARAVLATKVLAREQRLFDQRVSPRQDVERAQAEVAAANAEARRTRLSASAAQVTADGRGVAVTSPIAGRVTAAAISLGAFVDPQTELYRIADPSRLQVQAQVSGQDAQRISPGDRAVVETRDGRAIEGRVRAITPGLNGQTGAATAVLELASTGLQPGQFLRVRLFPRAPAATGPIVVPDEAVQSVSGRDVVFVRTANGFARTPVTVSTRSAGRAQIVAGLRPGQAIAARNAFLLKAELGKGEGEEH